MFKKQRTHAFIPVFAQLLSLLGNRNDKPFRKHQAYLLTKILNLCISGDCLSQLRVMILRQMYFGDDRVHYHATF